MTICVAVKVNDCMVFAADSATSMVSKAPGGKPVIHNVYNHGNKVFNLYKGLPLCAMTSGMGSFGPTSISTLAKDLRAAFADPGSPHHIDPTKYTLTEVAQKSYDFLYTLKYQVLPPQSRSSLDFWIGGYSTGGEHPELWKIEIDDAGNCAAPTLHADQGDCRISWSGQGEAVARLVLGFSNMLPDALTSAGIPNAAIPALMDHIELEVQNLLIEPAMPPMDAIQLADYLVETVKGYVRFQTGADVVGGDTDICVVTKYEGFKWIRRKHFWSTDLNPANP